MKNLLIFPVIIVIVLMITSSALAQPDLTYGTSICNFDDPWLTVGVLVRNIGNVTSVDSRIGIYISKSSSILGNYRIASQPVPSLGPNGLITISFNIDLTGDCNDWYAGFFIDYENTVSESNENNNIKIFESQIVIEEGCMADLDGFVAGIDDATGPVIDFGTCVVNNGNLEFSEPYDVNVYLSVDQNVTQSDYLIHTWSTSFGGLEWEQCNFPGPITIPGQVPPGEYYLGGWVDVNNVIVESNETNNGFVSTSEKIIVPNPPVIRPDLIVSSVSVTDQTGPGIAYQYSVRNQGSGGTGSGFKNTIYLSIDHTITQSDYKIDEKQIAALNAGATHNSGTVQTTISSVPTGDYYLGVYTDDGKAISESNEYNNTWYDDTPRVNIPVEFEEPEGNMISNWSFNAGSDNWFLFVQGGAAAAGSVQSGEYKIDIDNGGSENRHIQFGQTDLLIENGSQYEITFYAYAASPREIVSNVMKWSDPWNSFSGYNTHSLTTTKQSFTYSFVMSEPTSSQGALVFNVGASSIDVYLDNISLAETASSDVQPEETSQIVRTFKLFQNYPNPFNPFTTIRFQIPNPCFVSVKIFDMMGKEITELINEEKGPGEYTVEWNGKHFPSGMYFYRLKAGAFTETRKLVLQK